jgi:lipoprotein-anchoring transpeptidase ErfK/SrfK
MTISRRDFLKLVGGTAGVLAIRPFDGLIGQTMPLQEFPKGDNLGRLVATLDYRSAPRIDYPPLKKVYEDTVVPVIREVVAQTKDFNFTNQRWVETPDGFLYAGYVQPVKNNPNEPFKELPSGKAGFWAEVTVPYVDLTLENGPSSPWAKDLISMGRSPRLYYSQIVWIDQIKSGNSGQILYRFNEEGGRPAGITGGSYGELFWGAGQAFRPLTEDDIKPINPDVDPNEKKIVVNTTNNILQTLSCYEGQREVYFCTCSPGYVIPNDTEKDKSTPLGTHTPWRKTFSIHMSGGTTGAGYDTPAVSWTFLFGSETGVAIHSAFWHNHFGEQYSHGCVNVRPADAKWIFRWTNPVATFANSDIDMTSQKLAGTKVTVEDRQI